MMINIIPKDDIIPHVEFMFCNCGPKIKEHNGNTIIIHHSFDGREQLEEAYEILNGKKNENTETDK